MGHHPTNLEKQTYNFDKTQTWHIVQLFNIHKTLKKTKHKEIYFLNLSSFNNLSKMQLKVTRPFGTTKISLQNLESQFGKLKHIHIA